MKKEIKTRAIIAPEPVLIVATYDENGVADAMNVAWGGQCWDEEVALNISSDHKTTENLRWQKAFTLGIGTVDTLKLSDYFGITTGKKVSKIEHVGANAVRGEKVNAPILDCFPLCMECEVVSITDNGDGGVRVVGKVVRTVADESILDNDERIDFSKLCPIMFDSEMHNYYGLGKIEGRAFHDGAELR